MPSMFSVLPWIDAGSSAVGKCAAVIGDATSQYEFRLMEQLSFEDSTGQVLPRPVAFPYFGVACRIADAVPLDRTTAGSRGRGA